jgi:hypothetical protein
MTFLIHHWIKKVTYIGAFLSALFTTEHAMNGNIVLTNVWNMHVKGGRIRNAIHETGEYRQEANIATAW